MGLSVSATLRHTLSHSDIALRLCHTQTSLSVSVTLRNSASSLSHSEIALSLCHTQTSLSVSVTLRHSSSSLSHSDIARHRRSSSERAKNKKRRRKMSPRSANQWPFRGGSCIIKYVCNDRVIYIPIDPSIHAMIRTQVQGISNIDFGSDSEMILLYKKCVRACPCPPHVIVVMKDNASSCTKSLAPSNCPGASKRVRASTSTNSVCSMWPRKGQLRWELSTLGQQPTLRPTWKQVCSPL